MESMLPKTSPPVLVLLLLVPLLAAIACSKATWTPVPAGSSVRIEPDEALLIVHVDTDVPLHDLTLSTGRVVGPVPSGRHVWLVRLPAGSHRWESVHWGNNARTAERIALRDGAALPFDAVAGTINYAGELVIRRDSLASLFTNQLVVRRRNHAAAAVRNLARTSPEILRRYPIRQAATDNDGFLEHFSDVRESISHDPSIGEASERGVVEQSSLPSAENGLSAAAVFAEDGIARVRVSPSGEWVLAHAVRGTSHGLLIQGRGLPSVQPSFATSDPIARIDWAGPRTYVALVANPFGWTTVIGRVIEREGQVTFEHRTAQAPGLLVDPLPLIDDVVAWRVDYPDRSLLHRVTVDELEDHRSKRRRIVNGIFQIGEIVAITEPTVRRWVVDRTGEPRAALRVDEAGFTLLARPANRGQLRVVRRFGLVDRERVVPHAVTRDGMRLVVEAYGDRDKLGLFELDPSTGELVAPIFADDASDVTDVVIDAMTGDVMAVELLRRGRRRFHYFDTLASRHLEKVRERFPQDEIAVVSTDVTGDRIVFKTTGPDDPGTFRLLDAASRRTTRIAEAVAPVRDAELSEMETFRVRSSDGMLVEAFLTLPWKLPAAGAPLVVQPHGGPIGVHDADHFDALRQYLASWGFAVLQVNYRGSSGYGRAFLEAGMKQWGRAIEDDIDAAVTHVLARPEVDPSRICIAGGSYGGYSAVASVLRRPDRYRCAATLNGVMDLPLMFLESACSEWEPCFDAWRTIVGDPDMDRTELIEASPARRVHEIQTPILVAYGTRDRTVDPDHSHRLILMLEHHGKPHEVLEIDGAGHAPTRTEWTIYARVLRRFLSRHLFTDERFVDDPPASERGRPLSTERVLLSP